MDAKIKPEWLFAVAIAAGRGRGFAGDAKILRFAAAFGQLEAFRRQTALEQFAHGRGPAGHAARKAPIVHRFKFFLRQHDLQTLASGQIVHHGSFSPATLTMSKLSRTTKVPNRRFVKQELPCTQERKTYQC